MKKYALFLMFAGATLPSVTHAQVSIDMARVTCADYLALSPADSAVFSAWMSGWFNQKTCYVFVDLNAYARNVVVEAATDRLATLTPIHSSHDRYVLWAS